MKLRRFLSCMMALLLVCSLPVSALADEYDLSEGSVTVNASESGQTVTHKDTTKPDSAPVITQSTATTTNTITITATENATANVTIQDVNIADSDPSGAPPVDHRGEAAVTIDVAEGAEANVTLDGVNIDVGETGGFDSEWNIVDGEAAVQITGEGDVTIELDGENTVQGGYLRAGVEKNDGDSSGELTITDEKGTDGSLKATGGDCGSGIGGGRLGSGSNITITGSAEVTANGGTAGAGIGGGDLGSGSNITIEGSAEVTAKGGTHGAGIGGGKVGSGNGITISGSAQVEATGGLYASGIGGGYNYNGEGTGSNITVSGDAQVKAQGGSAGNRGAGAAIGNGGYNEKGEDAVVTTDAPKDGESYGLYVGELKEGWVATYEPGENMDTEKPGSLTYRDASGKVTTEHDSSNIGFEAALSATADAHGHEAGFKVGNKVIAVTTHNYGDYVSNPDATCTHDGTKTAMCTVPDCTETHTIPDPAKGHSFTNYMSDKNATYEADGTKTAKCDHCDATHTIPDPGSKLVREEAPQTAPLYRVIGQDGKTISCKAEQKGGVLTITVDADFATLTGSLSGLKTLRAQGVDTIVFVTNGATSTFALSDLLAQGGDSYKLTHDGEKVTFTLGSGEDISKILK